MSYRWRETSAAERGTSLVEVVITMLTMMIVGASLMGLFVSMQRSEAFARDRSLALDSMRLAMETMTKEVRQATAISSSTSDHDTIEIDTYVLGTSEHVVYTVSGETLTRQAGADPAVVIQENLAPIDAGATPLFAYAYPEGGTVAQTTVVTIRLRVNPERSPDTTLELKSEVRLRNRSDA